MHLYTTGSLLAVATSLFKADICNVLKVKMKHLDFGVISQMKNSFRFNPKMCRI